MTDAPSMAGTYMLATGGTGDIGTATATGLAALGAGVGITAPARIVTVSSGRPQNDAGGRSLVPGRPGAPAGLMPR